MALILNGTDGLSDVDGTAATPAIRGTDANTGIFFPAADTIAFSEGGTEAMRIDGSGNLNLKTTGYANSGVVALDAGDQAGFVGAANSTFVSNNLYFTSPTSVAYKTSAGGSLYEQNRALSAHIWYTSPSGTAGAAATISERMRIDSSGRLFVGYGASAVGYPAGSVGAVAYITKKGASNGLNVSGNTFNVSWADGLTGAHLWIDTTDLGQLDFVSDYRIKRNIETQTAPALEKVMALRPVTYQMADYGNLFKASEEVKEGFIAHEVQAVIPSGADGKKDAENQIQSLRLDAILAVAVKAIQELKATVDAQAARIAALENPPVES